MDLIVSLISDQPIPNIQVIKEFQNASTQFLFVQTPKMKKKECIKHITNACNIAENLVLKSETVEEYDIAGIENLYAKNDYKQYERVIVNLTGGTKIMSMTTFNYFKQLDNATMLYVMPCEKGSFICRYKTLFPTNEIVTFNTSINLKEYLTSYGYLYEQTPLSGVKFETTKKFCNFFLNNNMTDYDGEMLFIRKKRDKGVKKEDFNKICRLVEDSEFELSQENSLSKFEAQYLTGGWFEEFVYYKVKEDLSLDDDCIMTGVKLSKGNVRNITTEVKKLLGDDVEPKMETLNEFDVIFLVGTNLYIIECKTSIINTLLLPDGTIKEDNILQKTIYQVDSLKSNLGLFANSCIVTLSNFKQIIDVHNKGEKNNKINMLVGCIDRANLSKIKLIDRTVLMCGKNIKELI